MPISVSMAITEAKPMMIDNKLLVVAAALVDQDGAVLLGQRPMDRSLGGLWEFPGGKVEQGETPEAALIRELDEELAIRVKQACLAPFVFTTHDLGDRHLILLLYLIRRWDGEITPTIHENLKWVKPRDMRNYPMPEADKPLVSYLIDFL